MAASAFYTFTGNNSALTNRTFLGYATVEHQGLTQAFYLSSWIARGGADTQAAPPVSFGFNRAGWQVPAIPISIYTGKTTSKIIFPGLNLIPRTVDNDCPQPSVTGTPNGWNIGVSLVNLGTSSVTVKLSFVPDGSATPVISNQSHTIAAGHRIGIVAANDLPNNLGKGVLIATVTSGSAPVLGFASQSDDRFQFFGYGVTGQVVFNEGAGSTPSIITNLSSEFIVSYAARAGNTPPRNGYDTGISVFNPQSSQITVTFTFLRDNGSVASTPSFAVAANGALYKRMNDFPIADGFLGWVRVSAASPFYCSAHAVRGGFDSQLFGWQSFGFDIPAVPSSTVASASGLIFTALDNNPGEAAEDAPKCPPIPPNPEDTSPHDNGFDQGVRVTNIDTAALKFRLAYQPRFAGTSSKTSKRVSTAALHTLSPNQSTGIVVSSETFTNPDNLDPNNLTDGMLIVEVLDPSTEAPAARKVLGVVVQSDNFFLWFSYSVGSQQTSALP